MTRELQAAGRSRALIWVLGIIVVVFVLRLFYLQVIRHDHYVALADEEQLRSLAIPAKRGMIYALDGQTPVPIVMNETVYTVFADPQTVGQTEPVVTAIREIAGGNARKGFEELLTRKESRYQVIATKLTRTQADKLKERELSGIGFHEETQRVYPEKGLAGQLLGFVNAEGVGTYGVEGALDTRLSGTDGQRLTVADVRDVPLTIGDKNTNVPARDGDNIVLSVDRNVQSKAEEALKAGLDKAGATAGSALVMDPNTGRVLAMANYPSYDPAAFGRVMDAALFNNAIISAPYEPASVIKTFVMAAGIDKGVISPQTTYTNTDSIKVYDRTVFNAYRGMTGTRTMQEVLDNSLNTGTVTIAQRLGDGQAITRGARDTIYEYYHNRFGLGEMTGVELANESRGTLISPEEQEGNAVRYANMTFGQGMNVTMLQVAAGFSSVVNGGQYYQPTVVAGVLDGQRRLQPQEPKVLRQTVSAETSGTMRDMLHRARQSVNYMRDGDRGGYMIGGKTGTAETLKNGVYVKSETVGTYLGFGGTDRPEYVIMVQVSALGKNLEGGLHASPIFTDISNWMIDYLHLQPKG